MLNGMFSWCRDCISQWENAIFIRNAFLISPFIHDCSRGDHTVYTELDIVRYCGNHLINIVVETRHECIPVHTGEGPLELGSGVMVKTYRFKWL
jgi:hypothetical protein